MSDQPSRERRFVERLGALGEQGNRAALAALRRGLGHEPGETAEAARAFYPLLPGDVGMQEHDYWLVGTLFALYPSWRRPAEDGRRYTLADALVDLGRREPARAPGADQRMLGLLRADRQELPHHLRRAVTLLRSGGIEIEWVQLLRDLRWWGAPAGRVQQNWARDFWGAQHDIVNGEADEE